MNARIVIDPAVCHGKPIIRGLRYPVEMILELLSGSMTSDEILADYEDLEREDIFAALAYAARLVQGNRVELLTEDRLWKTGDWERSKTYESGIAAGAF